MENESSSSIPTSSSSSSSSSRVSLNDTTDTISTTTNSSTHNTSPSSASLHSSMQVWYIGIDGQRHGPLTWSKLCEASDANTLVWRDGLADWVPLQQCIANSLHDGFVDPVNPCTAHSQLDSHRHDPISSSSSSANGDIVKAKRVRKKRKPKPAPISSVYVSKLPEDITVDELVAHFKPVGIIKQDLDTSEYKVRIYATENGLCKGDATVHFLENTHSMVQPLSAETAVNVLNESQIRPHVFIKVEKAKFESSSAVKKKSNLSAAQLAVERRKKQREIHKLKSWDDDPDSNAGLRIVILKRMFDPNDEGDDDSFYQDLEEEIGIEIQKIAGPIEKLTVFKRSPLGAVAVKFHKGNDAETCIEKLDGRFFGGQRIECEFFDGQTNYKVQESEEEAKQRIERFGEWLDSHHDTEMQ